MTGRRFKAKELSRTVTYAGVITLDDLRKKFNIPADAEVYVRVPGGADWSNTDLDLKDAPVQVRWERVK